VSTGRPSRARHSVRPVAEPSRDPRATRSTHRRRDALVYRRRRRTLAAVVLLAAVVGLAVAGGAIGSASAPLAMPLLAAPWAWSGIALVRWSAGGDRCPASPVAATRAAASARGAPPRSSRHRSGPLSAAA
jgi:hypothetical protein